MAKPLRNHVDAILGHNANTIVRSYSLKRRWDQFWDEMSAAWDSWLLNEGDHALRSRILHSPQTLQQVDALRRFREKGTPDIIGEVLITAQEAKSLGIRPEDINLSSGWWKVNEPLDKALAYLSQKKITPKQVERLGYDKDTFNVKENANAMGAPLSPFGKMRLYFDTGSAGTWESGFLKASKAIALAFFLIEAALITVQKILYLAIDSLEWIFRFWPFDNYKQDNSNSEYLGLARFKTKEKFFLYSPLMLIGVGFYYWFGFAVETWRSSDSRAKELGIIIGSLLLSPVFMVASLGYWIAASIWCLGADEENPAQVIRAWRPSRYVHLPETQQEADIDRSTNKLGRPYKSGALSTLLKTLIAMPFLLVRFSLSLVYKLFFEVSGESNRWLNVFRAFMGAAAITLGVVGSVVLGWSLVTVGLPLLIGGVPFLALGLYYGVTKWRNHYPESISSGELSKPYYVRRQLFLKAENQEDIVHAEYAFAIDVACSERKGIAPVYATIKTGRGEYEVSSKESPPKSFFSTFGQPYKKSFLVKQTRLTDQGEPEYDIYCTVEFGFWDMLRVGHRAITIHYQMDETGQYVAVAAKEQEDVADAAKEQKEQEAEIDVAKNQPEEEGLYDFDYPPIDDLQGNSKKHIVDRVLDGEEKTRMRSSSMRDPEVKDSLDLAAALGNLSHVFNLGANSQFAVLSAQDSQDVLYCVSEAARMKPPVSISTGMGYTFQPLTSGRYSAKPMIDDKAGYSPRGTRITVVKEPLFFKGQPAGHRLTEQHNPRGEIDVALAERYKGLSLEDKYVYIFAGMDNREIVPYADKLIAESKVTIGKLHEDLQAWKARGRKLEHEDPEYAALKEHCLNMFLMLSGQHLSSPLKAAEPAGDQKNRPALSTLQVAAEQARYQFLESYPPRRGIFFRGIVVMEKAVKQQFAKFLLKEFNKVMGTEDQDFLKRVKADIHQKEFDSAISQLRGMLSDVEDPRAAALYKRSGEIQEHIEHLQFAQAINAIQQYHPGLFGQPELNDREAKQGLRGRDDLGVGFGADLDDSDLDEGNAFRS